MKGFRKGMDEKLKAKILGSLTDLDLEMIQRQRDYDETRKDSISAKILLENDPVRRNIIKLKDTINKMIVNIKHNKYIIDKFSGQLSSGKIDIELRPGVVMNKDELEIELETRRGIMWAESKDIVPNLAEMRVWVGRMDITKNVIMTEKQFDEYVMDVEKRLKSFGCELYGIS